ncbi:MAG: hypothetical protein L3J25_00695 [Flavobacteriaceae bacterium]|nr:hypothetical protein [Flavobacteriaceae bacterium]
MKKNYPDLSIEQAYKKFIIEIENSNNSEWGNPRMSLKSRKIFDSSKLKSQVYGITDSVWVELNNGILHLKTRRKYQKPDGEFVMGTNTSSSASYHEGMFDTVYMNKQMKTVDFNHYGKYQQALDSISRENEFVLNYLEAMKKTGRKRHPSFVAYEMIMANVNYTDYFIKRLILTEIVY